MSNQESATIPGGIDLIIRHTHSPRNVSIMFQRLLHKFWKDLVIEDAFNGEIFLFTQLHIAPEFTNMFAYKNRDAFEKWSQKGFSPDLENTMIQIISEPGIATVITSSSPSLEIQTFIKDFKKFLNTNTPF